MADLHVVSALQRKYAEMLGQLRKAEDRVERLRADLAHVEAAIRIFHDDWDSATVKPRRPRAQSRWLRKGQGIQTALTVLREASEPMTSREIALRVVELRGLTDTQGDAMKAIVSSLNGCLKRNAGVEMVEGNPKRWQLTGKEAEPSGGWRNGSRMEL